MNTKICPICGQEKPISEFGRDNRCHDGSKVACKVCKPISDKLPGVRGCLTGNTQIYALVDPRDNAYRYVGRTVNRLSHRRSCHISDGRYRQPSPKQDWILELESLDLKPGIRLLEVVKSEDAPDRESFWMGEFTNQGYDLVNDKLSKHYVNRQRRKELREKKKLRLAA